MGFQDKLKSLFSTRLENISEKLSDSEVLKKPEDIRLWLEQQSAVAWLMGAAYVCATIAGALSMSQMMRVIGAGKSRVTVAATEGTATVSFSSRTNLRDARKSIMERNLFNSEGKFPEEKFQTEGAAKLAGFRLDAPCNPSALNIELLGTIFLGNPLISIATVKEKGLEDGDVYKVGDIIIGSTNAVVAAVERQRLIINNDGTKECFDLNKNDENDVDARPVTGGVASTGSDVTLESSFVESELGPGFGKIIESARLVPNATESGINGFKIFAIRPDSLFSRAGFQNGDVITQVNDTSLTQPDQGFALYQALQDEKSIRVNVLRDGSQPATINVKIK